MKFTRKSVMLVGLGAALLFIGYGLWSAWRADQAAYEWVAVRRGDIKQEVIVTGRVRPAQSVELAFERGGKVAVVTVGVGERVVAGQALVQLENAELSAELARSQAAVENARAGLIQYQAVVEREEARLQELRRGTRLEEVKLSETKVASAKQALADARRNLDQTTNKAAIDLVNTYEVIRDLLRDAHTKADDAVNRQTDPLFFDDASPNPQLTFVTLRQQAKIEAEGQRRLATRALEDFKPLLTLGSLSLFSLEEALKSGKQHLAAIRNFLQQTNEALSEAAGLTATQSDGYRANVTLGLSNVNTALAALNSQEQKIAAQRVVSQNSLGTAETRVNEAQSALEAAEAELNLKRAPATAEELAAQAAAVKQAQANADSQRARIREVQAAVEGVRAQLNLTAVRAPFRGVVTKQDAKVGEIVAGNLAIVTIISEAAFEIEANVPEVDIAKLAVGNEASVTLDAYGEEAVWRAKVVAIDPAETVVEGVSTYKVRLQFSSEDERIKSGLTANVTILAASRENALLLPQRALSDKNGGKAARRLQSASSRQVVEEVAVRVGLAGSDGEVEILEGLVEGDKVVTGEKDAK